jgi:ketosteroid isomerase-like protein
MASWKDILGAPGHFHVYMQTQQVVDAGDMVLHFGLEHIQAGDDLREATVSVLNAYERTSDGWRMRVHHAAPVHEDIPVNDDNIH